ncbi:MFS transporter [Streptosporangium sp. NPDC050855]|uniref:MFS transporter n=1 Tax=Streptosporangium sp. NPDC050855 TaxID=3366194 RepID=UPI0037A7BA63
MTTADVASGTPARAGWRQWAGLAVMCLPTMLTTVDITVMFLALPHVSADLGAGGVEQLWISDIYGFMIAGFLVTMGTLGDRIGRRKVLLAGAAMFVAASLLAAYATSTPMLIGARALLGVAGATVAPSVLALIRDMFPDPRQMGTAMAVWGSSIMAGVILGPVVGGLLLGAFWWGSIFLMAVPVMGLLLLTAPFLVPESRNPDAGRLDVPSVLLSLGAVLPLIYGLKELARGGPAPQAAAAILLGAACALVFVRRQRTLTDPLLDLRLFGIRVLSGTMVLSLMFAFVMGGTGLVVTLFLQLVQGYSPSGVALWMVLPAVVMIVMGNVAGAVARVVRPAYLIAAGAVLAAAGMVVLTRVGASGDMPLLMTGLVMVYAGGSPITVLSPLLVMTSAPPERAGSAGSLQSTGSEFGTAMGVAVLGLVATAVYRTGVTVPAGVPDGAAQAARESISGAVLAAQRFPGQAGGELLASAREAFTSGLHVTAVVTAVVFLGLAAVALAGLRRVPPTGAAQAGGPQEAGTSPAGEAAQTAQTGAGTPGEAAQTGAGRPEGAGASGPARAPEGAGEMSVR